MPKKLTTEIFIKKAKLIHGDRYDYSLVNFVNHRTKVRIICKEHGEFSQIPNSHLYGANCPDCSGVKKYTNETFIKKSKNIHNDKYNYSLVNYINNDTKVKIICPIHGIFEQVPSSHLIGRGCKRCACIKTNENVKISISDFIKRSNIIHNNKFDYSLIITLNNVNDKVKIICPIHGIFEQVPAAHLGGYGCKECRNNNFKLGKEQFIKNVNITHNNKYDYSLVNYINNKTHVIIICPIHGEFKQRPDGHSYGRGCNCCSKNGADKIFKNKKLYILYDENVKLYKIGISYNIKNRIKNINKKINSKIVCIREYDYGTSIFEKNIHLFLLEKRKNHPIYHGGYTEWFFLNDDDLIQIDKLIYI